jgi:hypothetical protein
MKKSLLLAIVFFSLVSFSFAEEENNTLDVHLGVEATTRYYDFLSIWVDEYGFCEKNFSINPRYFLSVEIIPYLENSFLFELGYYKQKNDAVFGNGVKLGFERIDLKFLLKTSDSNVLNFYIGAGMDLGLYSLRKELEEHFKLLQVFGAVKITFNLIPNVVFYSNINLSFTPATSDNFYLENTPLPALNAPVSFQTEIINISLGIAINFF